MRDYWKTCSLSSRICGNSGRQAQQCIISFFFQFIWYLFRAQKAHRAWADGQKHNGEVWVTTDTQSGCPWKSPEAETVFPTIYGELSGACPKALTSGVFLQGQRSWNMNSPEVTIVQDRVSQLCAPGSLEVKPCRSTAITPAHPCACRHMHTHIHALPAGSTSLLICCNGH